eukprot:GFUD01043026.1.p1 GENE.GFUD01043026.1~~GFUD01043026.1.p1  ORF type:complete len:697 (-),score=204.72 GFUD01043026.1:693-2783(-)
MGGNELEVLEHYNRKIQKYGEHKDATEILLKCLCKLDQVRVNISLLQNTGIGRTVSALKKRYGDHEIGTRSRDLVNKWKDLVAQEENDEEDNGEAEDNEEEDSGEADPGAQQTDPEPPAYIPTPIAPAYTPTPIDELPTVAETSNGYGDTHDDNKHDKKAKSQLKEREKSSEKESDHHKSKKKKSHRERNSEEKEQSKSSVNGKSDRESEKRKEKERSHKHRHSDKERESKPGDKDRSSKEKVKDHRSSSKSSHKEKSKDSESDRKSDNKHSDKDKHRTKDKESKPRIKEEKCDSYDDKVKSKESVGSSGVKVKEERLDFGYGDVVDQKVKKEPVENGFDFMKENDLREIKKSKDKEKKSKEKSKEDERKKSKSRELANVDIFSKSMDNSDDESKSRKRSRDEERVDFSKSKRPKQDSTQKFVLPAPPSFLPPLPTGPSLIPEISPVYKPLPRLPLQNMAHVVDDRNTDEESLSILLSNKNKNRAAIYSGTKRKGFYGEVPTLFSQCIQVLKDHVDEIDEVGNLGYDILKPVLERAFPKTLQHIEDCNPYLMEDTAELWEKFVKKDFRNKEREDMESWREMFERCTLERAEKLDALKGKVKQCYKAEEDNHRKTKLAYVDIAPKAPRSVRNAQAKHGTALPVGHSMVAGATRPRNQLGDPTASASRAGMGSKKPRAAPMMAKTLKLMKGMKGGFRR